MLRELLLQPKALPELGVLLFELGANHPFVVDFGALFFSAPFSFLNPASDLDLLLRVADAAEGSPHMLISLLETVLTSFMERRSTIVSVPRSVTSLFLSCLFTCPPCLEFNLTTSHNYEDDDLSVLYSTMGFFMSLISTRFGLDGDDLETPYGEVTHSVEWSPSTGRLVIHYDGLDDKISELDVVPLFEDLPVIRRRFGHA